MLSGSFYNIRDLLMPNLRSGSRNKIRWGFFIPSEAGIQYLLRLASTMKLKPVIDSIYEQKTLPQAYQKVIDGKLRGKVVIDFSSK